MHTERHVQKITQNHYSYQLNIGTLPKFLPLVYSNYRILFRMKIRQGSYFPQWVNLLQFQHPIWTQLESCCYTSHTAPCKTPRKVAEEDPSAWAPTPVWETQLKLQFCYWSIWGVYHWMENPFFSLHISASFK